MKITLNGLHIASEISLKMLILFSSKTENMHYFESSRDKKHF